MSPGLRKPSHTSGNAPPRRKLLWEKYTRVNDPSILQHAYDSETRFMEPVPYPNPEGVKTILEQLGVSGQPTEAFIAEFIDNRFMKQLSDEGLVKQLYPGGIPTR